MSTMLVFQINKTAAIGVPNQSWESLTLFLAKYFLFKKKKNRSVYIAAGHVSVKTLYLFCHLHLLNIR